MSLGEDRVVHHSKIRCQLTALGSPALFRATLGVSGCPLLLQLPPFF